MFFPGAVVVAVAALAATPSPAPRPEATTAQPLSRVVHLFDYNRSVPLSVRVASQTEHDSVTIEDVSFAIDGASRATGYLAIPAGAGPFPAIVFAPGRTGTKDVFKWEAILDAERGVLTLSLDDLDNGYPHFNRSDRGILSHRVVALRRAIDLVLAQPGVDRTRLGFVGHSDGAEMGGILAAIDRRASAYVLMSGGGIWDRSKNRAYGRLIAPFDADNYIGRAAPAALLFQAGLADQFIPRPEALRYQALGSRPKSVKWYAADHWLDQQAEHDRQTWLAGRLGFTAPSVVLLRRASVSAGHG